jgi:putative transposase
VSAFVDTHRERFGVEPICRALDVSASAYRQRRTGKRSRRAVEDARLLERIREIHETNYFAYGSRRMWKALRRAGERIGRGRVERLMSRNGIQGAKRRGKPWRTTTPDPEAHRRPDLVQRDFTAGAPNELWVADLTYLRCWEGVVYLAFIVDVFSRMIVGWQIASHMRKELVLDALRMAIGLRGSGADVELVHHSDRGSQGGFKWSSQRSIEGSCDGSPQASEVGSGGAAAIAVAGSAASGTSGASCAVLGGDRSRVVECGRGGRGRRVGGRWRPVVSRVWRDAAVCDPFSAVGALSVVC